MGIIFLFLLWLFILTIILILALLILAIKYQFIFSSIPLSLSIIPHQPKMAKPKVVNNCDFTVPPTGTLPSPTDPQYQLKATDTQGYKSGSTITLAPGVIITLTGSLFLIADGDITINGFIDIPSQNAPGG